MFSLEVIMQKYTDTVIIDPPEGWKYGFPKEVEVSVARDDEALSNFFRENGYPEEQIPMALKHSRYWG